MAASASSPTVLRWYIALELGNLRKRAGLTLVQVAQRIGRSKSHVGHLETGHTLPVRTELEALLDFYEVGERIPSFVELLAAAKTGKDWWEPFKGGAAPDWFDLFLGLESSASQIESYDAHVVPGLFQTAIYAAAVIRAEEPEPEEPEVARRVDLRQARQDLLTRKANPPSVWSILDESVLYRDACGAHVLRAQLEHLAKLADRPNINILVLPMSAGPHAGSYGTFTILSFPDLISAPAVAYTEGMVRGSYHEEPAAVLRYRNALTQLHNLALSPEESLARIVQRAKELS